MATAAVTDGHYVREVVRMGNLIPIRGLAESLKSH